MNLRLSPLPRAIGWLFAAAMGLLGLAVVLYAWRLWPLPARPPHPGLLDGLSLLVTLALAAVLMVALHRLQRALIAQQASARHHRALVDALPIGLVVWDPEDRFVLCNADFRVLYPELQALLAPGLRFDELLRRALAAGLVPEAAGREEAWRAERLARHRQPGEPIVRRMADGRWRRIVEHRLADGTLLSHSVDISELVEQKAALEAARQDTERARRTLIDAVEALPAGFELYDAEDRLVMINRRMAEMYPLIADLADRRPSFEQVVRTHHARGGLPDLPGGLEAWLETRQAQRRQGGIEHVFKQADGRWIRVLEKRTSDGGLVGIRIDVTEFEEQRRALDRARDDAEQARRTLVDAVEALPAGFELYDADDRLVMTNQVMRQLYPHIGALWDRGMSFEQLVRANHQLGGLGPLPLPFEEWLAGRLHQRRSGGPPRVHQVADGHWVRTYERPLPSGGLVGVRIDVTEVELSRAQARVAQQAAELAAQRLRDAIDALPDGFALFDADDRLVMCNARYREIYAASASAIVEGLTFEQVLRHAMSLGQFAAAVGREETWLADRIEAHRHPRGPLLQELPDNRWLRIDERPTREGGVAGVRTDVTELVRREQELHAANQLLNSLNSDLSRLSETDALTGLANRRRFDRQLADAWLQARLEGLPLALAIIDVDHFKRYNDRHGHPAGDACLQQVAAVLRDTARRPTDLVARLGGEEFALLLPQDDAAAAGTLAQRCLAALERAALPHGDSPVAPQVTISIGVADLAGLAPLPEDADASALMHAADVALYAAKEAGRHRVVVAHPPQPAG